MNFRFAYQSTITIPILETEVFQLAHESALKNSLNDVTGLLIFQFPHFFHILEGNREAIETLIFRIEKDPRHQKINRIYEESDHERYFEGFSFFGVQEKDSLLTPRISSLKSPNLASGQEILDIFRSFQKMAHHF